MQLERSAADKDAALAILRQAAGAGVNHLDTAQFYGACNELIRAALAPYDDDLVLVTKVGAVWDADAKPLPLVPAQRPAELRAQVEANLASLGTERLGVVNLRRLDARPGIIAEGEQRVDLDDQLAELSALRDEGKIGGIGLSNVSAGQLAPGAAGRDRVRAELLQRHSTGPPSPSSTCAASTASPGSRSSRSARPASRTRSG